MSTTLGCFVGRFGRVALFCANEPVSEHAHSQAHVLIKIDGADGSYVVDDETVQISDEQLVLINPWVPHSNSRASKSTATTLLALYLEPMWLGMISQSLMRDSTNTLFSNASGRTTEEIRKTSYDISSLLQGSIGQEEFLEELLLSLIREILSLFSAQPLRQRLPQPRRQVDHRIRNAVIFMREHTSKILSINEVARHCGLSRSRFYEQFRSCMGVSPKVYLDTLCIENAIHQMVTTDKSLAVISEILGFSAQSHFTRFFSSKTGVPPSDIRNVIYELNSPISSSSDWQQ